MVFVLNLSLFCPSGLWSRGRTRAAVKWLSWIERSTRRPEADPNPPRLPHSPPLYWPLTLSLWSMAQCPGAPQTVDPPFNQTHCNHKPVTKRHWLPSFLKRKVALNSFYVSQIKSPETQINSNSEWIYDAAKSIMKCDAEAFYRTPTRTFVFIETFYLVVFQRKDCSL